MCTEYFFLESQFWRKNKTLSESSPQEHFTDKRCKASNINDTSPLSKKNIPHISNCGPQLSGSPHLCEMILPWLSEPDGPGTESFGWHCFLAGWWTHALNENTWKLHVFTVNMFSVYFWQTGRLSHEALKFPYTFPISKYEFFIPDSGEQPCMLRYLETLYMKQCDVAPCLQPPTKVLDFSYKTEALVDLPYVWE